MLKDLEQRRGNQHTDNAGVSVPVMVNKSSSKNVFVITVSVLMTLAAVYLFYLQSENQRLASLSPKNNTVTTEVRSNTTTDQSVTLRTKTGQLKTLAAEQLTIAPPVLSQNKSVIQVSASQTPAASSSNKGSATFLGNGVGYNGVVEGSVQSTPPAAYLSALTEQNSAITKPKVEIAQGSTIEITRKQLTPKTLAKQKMSQAKEAVDNNDIPKAEQLFQDVLLILPSEKYARKQLAALWFGRKSYQAALDLLAQGIELDAKDYELRLLKAQIHIRRQQYFAAFQVLQAHPALEMISDVNYHAVLANQAQGSKQYKYAISAYLRLTRLQPHTGRWWLGLGIGYDSNSQFTLAKETYRTALTKYDLSTSARQFISQRLQELGK